MEKRSNEDDRGNLLVRAGGGHKLHIISPEQVKFGGRGAALCGHQPIKDDARNGRMKPRGRWYHANSIFGDRMTCDKCASIYEGK